LVFDNVLTTLQTTFEVSMLFQPKNLVEFRKNNYPLTIFEGKISWSGSNEGFVHAYLLRIWYNDEIYEYIRFQEFKKSSRNEDLNL